MFGIPIDGPANVFCDNESVYSNSTFYESQINRKHQYIYLHMVCECVADGILISHKVNSNYNLAYLVTRSLSVTKYIALRSWIMYNDKPNIGVKLSNGHCILLRRVKED